MQRENGTWSYLGPVTNEVVIDAAQFDRFGIIAAETLYQCLNRIVEIECGNRSHIRNGIKKESLGA
jgi:hypothetical protein